MKNKKCVTCQAEYEIQGNWASSRKYCSVACFGKSRRNQVEKTCRNCGDTFMFKPSQMASYPNAGKYCSRKCGYDYRVKKNADRPSTDRYGRTRRVKDIEWQRTVREQDKSICRRCKRYDQYIHTHHLAARSRRPDLKYDPNNGICLCASCHAWVHHHPKISMAEGWIISTGSNV